MLNKRPSLFRQFIPYNQIGLIALISLVSSSLISCERKSDLLKDEYKTIDYVDIQPLLKKSCLKCHSSEGFAPFSFEQVNFFQKKKSTLLEVLDRGIMPPWKPDNHYSKFKNQYGLNKEEISMLYSWIYFGASHNSGQSLPKLPAHKILQNKKNGYCLQFSNQYIVPDNNDHYSCFTVPNPFGSDVYLSSIDLIPGDNRIVHHISAFMQIHEDANRKEHLNKDFNCDGEINEESKMVANWTMGSFSSPYKNGRGFMLPKNASLYVQVHFTDGSKGLIDNSMICFQKMSDTLTEEVYYGFKNNFDISFEPNQKKNDTLVIDVIEDIRMLTIWPHTHQLAVSVECFATTPDQQLIKLIRIPKWDYFWHSSYEFIEDIFIPKGSKIFMAVNFDNTTSNKNNPHFPPQKVIYGRSSKDEMLTLAYSYVKAN